MKKIKNKKVSLDQESKLLRLLLWASARGGESARVVGGYRGGWGWGMGGLYRGERKKMYLSVILWVGWGVGGGWWGLIWGILAGLGGEGGSRGGPGGSGAGGKNLGGAGPPGGSKLRKTVT